MPLQPSVHIRALGSHPAYPARGRVRAVAWDDADPSYAPVEFVHDAVLKNAATSKTPWADVKLLASWKDTRFSYCKSGRGRVRKLSLLKAGCWHKKRPRNPCGRTGMRERGLLGKYGPNHAADPIVTRVRPGSNPPVLEVVVVQRKDTGEYALPGGMTEDKPRK